MEKNLYNSPSPLAEMQEDSVKKIAIIVTILGLLFLFIYAEEVELQKVETIDNIPVEENVKISGKISKLVKNNNTYFLVIEGKKIEMMDIILFPKEEIYLKEGQFVEVEGVVEEYLGKKEIIASRIVVGSS